MRWIRKARGEFRTLKGPILTDEEVRAIYCLASVASLIACRRLSYLSSFGKASPFLRALLQGGTRAHPWVAQIQEDLSELQRVTPKLASLPPPQVNINVWVDFAISHAKAWKRFLKAWNSPFGESSQEDSKIACIECGKLCVSKGLGAHQLKEHGKIRIARLFRESDGICPVCHLQCGSRQHCIHHIHHRSASCLAGLELGLFLH